MVNTDQLDVILVIGRNNFICKIKSSKQVLNYKKDEKYIFTSVISVTKIEKVFTNQSV